MHLLGDETYPNRCTAEKAVGMSNIRDGMIVRGQREQSDTLEER